MGIEAGIYSRLTGSTAITALVGTRIYPQVVPQGASYPNARFLIISDEIINHRNAQHKLHNFWYHFR